MGLTYETHLNHKVSNRLDFPYQKNCQKAKKCFKQTYFSLLNNCKKFKDVEQDFRMLNVLCGWVFRKWVLMIWRKEKQISTIHTVKNDFLSFENLNFRVLLQQPILLVLKIRRNLFYSEAIICCLLCANQYVILAASKNITHLWDHMCRSSLKECSLLAYLNIFNKIWPNHR